VGKPKLILLDTWAANLGADENSVLDSMNGIPAFQQLCAYHGSAGLIVHHVGHGDKSRARGSSALKAALDMEYLVEQDKDKTIRVTNTKAKDSELSSPMAFVVKSVELGTFDKNGKPHTSGVIQSISYSPPKEGSKEPTGKWQKVSLSVLEALVAEEYENNQVDYSCLADVGIPKSIWRDASYEAGVPRTQYYSVSTSLLEANKITIENGKVFPV
jgi:hypothetical protein